MPRKIWPLLGAMLLMATLSLSGCAWFKGPQKKPETTPPPPLQSQSMQAEPDITVYMHETGEKKTMKMEDYIAGVVAGEMKNDWPVEALAAQAILARTFTVEAIETKGGVPARGTQASTDIKEFQAYDAKAINDNVRKAVDMTRGLIITYQGRPIHAWFHSSAGGVTALAKEGLNFKEAEPAYTESVPSPDDLAPADIQHWQTTFTKSELMAALKKMGTPVSAISSVEIGQKGPSGRTTTVTINKTLAVSGPDLRVALDSTKLKSMLLDNITMDGDTVTFSGKGYGHGVGVSQWGARKMAESGKTAGEIINYYFKNVALEKRWQ